MIRRTHFHLSTVSLTKTGKPFSQISAVFFNNIFCYLWETPYGLKNIVDKAGLINYFLSKFTKYFISGVEMAPLTEV